MILTPDAEPSRKDAAPTISLERVAVPYYVFRDAGMEVVLASSDGGDPFLERLSAANATPEILRFKQDKVALEEFRETLQFDQIFVEDFDVAFCVGGLDAVWNARDVGAAGFLVAQMLDAGKLIGFTPSRADLAPRGRIECLIIGAAQNSPAFAANALLRTMRQL
jgi:hypothetical protein